MPFTLIPQPSLARVQVSDDMNMYDVSEFQVKSHSENCNGMDGGVYEKSHDHHDDIYYLQMLH